MTNRDELRAAYVRLQDYIEYSQISSERDRQALADLRLLGAALAVVLERLPEQALPKRRKVRS